MNNDIKQVSQEEFKVMEAEGMQATVIDVRNQDEWDAGHIEGARLIPLPIVEEQIEELILDKNTEIIMYCRSGGRAGRALQILQVKGYTNIANLEGGYLDYLDR